MSHLQKFTEAQIYNLCIFLSVCYTSIKKFAFKKYIFLTCSKEGKIYIFKIMLSMLFNQFPVSRKYVGYPGDMTLLLSNLKMTVPGLLYHD